MIPSHHFSKMERGLLSRGKERTVLIVGNSRQHFVGHALLPRRGINGAYSQLTLILFGDDVANELC